MDLIHHQAKRRGVEEIAVNEELVIQAMIEGWITRMECRVKEMGSRWRRKRLTEVSKNDP